LTWVTDYKLPVGDTVATAQVVEAEPSRFQVIVGMGATIHTEFTTSLEEARRRVEQIVTLLWPEATTHGWVAR
jgi:hypothetical protein